MIVLTTLVFWLACFGIVVVLIAMLTLVISSLVQLVQARYFDWRRQMLIKQCLLD